MPQRTDPYTSCLSLGSVGATHGTLQGHALCTCFQRRKGHHAAKLDQNALALRHHVPEQRKSCMFDRLTHPDTVCSSGILANCCTEVALGVHLLESALLSHGLALAGT